jgi:hypothetical protein
LKKRLIFLFVFGHETYYVDAKLNEMRSKDDFIVVTNEIGSRGVDYKAPSPSHVIICLNDLTKNELT